VDQDDRLAGVKCNVVCGASRDHYRAAPEQLAMSETESGPAVGEVWTRGAGWVEHPWRATGGRLTLDDQHLRFRPHWFDRLLFAKEHAIPLGQIAAVRVSPINPFALLAGGLRRRIELSLKDGRTQRIVIKSVDQAAAELTQRIGRPADLHHS
jgi:hypothetical protein